MPEQKPRFAVPWFLLIVLGLYGLGVLGYVWHTYWNSPEYQAAEHYWAAVELLGVSDGKACPPENLEPAMVHLLEAARLMPTVKRLAERAEGLRWRFEERKVKLPDDLKRKAELVSAAALREEQARQATLVVGARDRGWGAEQLLDGPQRAVLWSIPGAVLIVVFWIYTERQRRQRRGLEREQYLREQEAEVEQLGAHRRGVPTNQPPPQAAARQAAARGGTAKRRPVQRKPNDE